MTGTVDDPTATVIVNSIPAAVVNGSFSVALPLAEGPNLVTATATSADGAAGTATLTVTLDTTPPHVTITSPADRFVTTDSTMAIAGIVNDIVVGTVNAEQARVTVNGAAAQVSNRTFLASTVPLALGPNVIQAVARDRVGNQATTQITVTRQADGARRGSRRVSGSNQSGPIGSALPAPLVVALTDGAGNPVPNKPVIFKVTAERRRGRRRRRRRADGDRHDRLARARAGAMDAGSTRRRGRQYRRGVLRRFHGTALFTATGTQGPAGKIVDRHRQRSDRLDRVPAAKAADRRRRGRRQQPTVGVPVTFTRRSGRRHLRRAAEHDGHERSRRSRCGDADARSAGRQQQQRRVGDLPVERKPSRRPSPRPAAPRAIRPRRPSRA